MNGNLKRKNEQFLKEDWIFDDRADNRKRKNVKKKTSVYHSKKKSIKKFYLLSIFIKDNNLQMSPYLKKKKKRKNKFPNQAFYTI